MDETNDKSLTSAESSKNDDLVGWVMARVDRWRTHRDKNYKRDWDKYYYTWIGQYDESLRVRNAERSTIISPATQNAIDQTVSEMVEATFGRGNWFDVEDNQNTQAQQIAIAVRNNLLDDFHRDRVVAAVTDVYYNGAIFGTGIAKRIVERGAVNRVFWEAIRPHNFVIDTAATNVNDALGCAHETIRPEHEIRAKQATGEYFPADVGPAGISSRASGSTSSVFDFSNNSMDPFEADPADGVNITEYHGLVPAEMLKGGDKESPDEDLLEGTPEAESDEYVEAIVVIANGSSLLKATANPIKDGDKKPDRGFIAYQHHKNPNNFWGIGQAQKAANAQSGLDGELRARNDTLALTTYPMVGADATRLPKNLKLEVRPGKMLLTNGRPSEVIEQLKLGALDPVSFQQSAEYERMVQMATGANDPAKQINPAAQNTTATGASIQSTGFIKRAKLTMQNVDADFLDPLVKKSLWAYMTVAPNRYPHEVTFKVDSTMSIMAREFEQAQMTNLLAIVPPDSPLYPIVMQGIVENYSGPSKDKMLQAVQAIGKPDPQQQAMEQQTQALALQKAENEVKLLQAQINQLESQAGLNTAKSNFEQVKVQQAPAELALEARQTRVGEANSVIAAAKVHQGVHATKTAAAAKAASRPQGSVN